MKLTQTFALALPALSAAHPGMSQTDAEAYLHKREIEARALEERQRLSGLIGTVQALTNTVSGLLGGIANNISPDNKRPEPGFDFIAPGPGDSRGPCPGLNLLANHGYLPRNGIVTFEQTIEAVTRGFNMGVDLATVLATFAVLTGGDIATQTYALGSITGADGLNRHSTVESDVSPNREDFYNGCGDNHHLSSRMFKQNVGFVALDPRKEFTVEVMAKQYAANADFSKKNNPFIYFFPFPQIVSIAAYPFYPDFFANGTFGAGGVANYESISSIVGAQYNDKTGDFTYVPERWPENWYGRAIPYGAVQALTDGFLRIYPANIIVPGVAQIGTPNLSIQTVLCDVYQGINSITPLVAAGSLEAAAKFASSKLGPVLGPGTALGCPDSTLSPNLFFPKSDQVGGPKNSPPKSDANTGNNVYNKVYFKTAPVRQLARVGRALRL